MAGRAMSGLILLVFGGHVLAYLGCVGATGMEAAALGRIGGRGDIALKHYAVHLYIGIGMRDRREESLGIGVEGVLEDVLLVTELNHSTKIHNAYLIRDELNYRQIVRNEEVGKVHRLLKLLQKIDYLCLNGNVERGYGLVTYDELGIYGQGARNTDTLTLTARKLVRISLVVIIAQTAPFHKLDNVILYLAFRNDLMHVYRL